MYLLIPISYRVARLRDSIAHLSSYLYLFIEPQLKIKWETAQYRYWYVYLQKNNYEKNQYYEKTKKGKSRQCYAACQGLI